MFWCIAKHPPAAGSGPLGLCLWLLLCWFIIAAKADQAALHDHTSLLPRFMLWERAIFIDYLLPGFALDCGFHIAGFWPLVLHPRLFLCLSDIVAKVPAGSQSERFLLRLHSWGLVTSFLTPAKAMVTEMARWGTAQTTPPRRLPPPPAGSGAPPAPERCRALLGSSSTSLLRVKHLISQLSM